MNAADFIKLPADQAADIYLERLGVGDAERAFQLHKAYYVIHRIRLVSTAV